MKKIISVIVSFMVVIISIFFANRANYAVPKRNPAKMDIYYIFAEGERINNGINPYARILDGDMLNNNKYPTYFPLFYEVSYISMKFGLHDFDNWVNIWKKIFFRFDYAIALLLFTVFAIKKIEWSGVVAAGFWLFNRWTLYIITTTDLDFIPIFFMLAAFILFPKNKWLAMLLFSISLGFKQIGIFVAPLFIIWAYRAEENQWNGIKQALKSAGVIASIPLVSSLPFIYWNLEGFVKSILFSATRLNKSSFGADSLDALLGWEGLPARIPMVFMLLAIYWMAAKGIGKNYLPAVLIFIIFISFNTVLYSQYLVWLIALIPLLIADYLNKQETIPLPE